MCSHSGLSPRVRGNPVGAADGLDLRRSIPADAEEPIRPRPRSRPRRVYPRGCGGTGTGGGGGGSGSGLSPRVRGNLLNAVPNPYSRGSIPAGAGEPSGTVPLRSWRKVYPRGCGGTAVCRTAMRPSMGLSPRVRGNPLPRPGVHGSGRSIPAGAGEPDGTDGTDGTDGVYPRGCGGTLSASGPIAGTQGLSPRVRGNLLLGSCLRASSGSIPAGAGEPGVSLRAVRDGEVYPPRVRGNLEYPSERYETVRSIPAGAGEPEVRHGDE